MSDPVLAFSTPVLNVEGPNGHEPMLGGELRQKAVWVDQAVCIGCSACKARVRTRR